MKGLSDRGVDTGRVYATGNNKFGQLGIGNKNSLYGPILVHSLMAHKISKIACWNHSACLTEKGELYIWGTGVFGEYLTPLSYLKGRVPCKDISVGNFFGAAVEDNGRVWVWGSNAGGELGLGDYESRVNPTLNEHLRGKRGLKVSCGGNFVAVVGNTINPRRMLEQSSSPLRSKKKPLIRDNGYNTPGRSPQREEEAGYDSGFRLRTSLEDIVQIRSTESYLTGGRSALRKEARSPTEGTGRGRSQVKMVSSTEREYRQNPMDYIDTGKGETYRFDANGKEGLVDRRV